MVRKMRKDIARSITILCGALVAVAGAIVLPGADTAQATTPRVGTYKVTHMTHREHNSYVVPTKISVIYTLKVYSYKNEKAKLSKKKTISLGKKMIKSYTEKYIIPGIQM